MKKIILSFVGLLFTYVSNSTAQCPNDKHPHAIDLGLSVKWACCDVFWGEREEALKTPQRYMWGDVVERYEYYDLSKTPSTSDYPYINKRAYDSLSWTEQSDDDIVDKLYTFIGKDISGTKYDVAHVQWGGKWRMPTLEQFEELEKNCKIRGKQIIGPNGNYIELVFTTDSPRYNHYYWTSTLSKERPSRAYAAYLTRSEFNASDCYLMIYDDKLHGFNYIRPVCY